MIKASLIGPFDRILRVVFGVMLLIVTYAMNITSTWFAAMHVLTIYLWITTMVVWDPFYAVINKCVEIYREHRDLRGEF
ncbi:MAG: hypothetical protein OEW58_08035 [Gammaproteobacteria bacterium]|nr:hypothetical protein [Gammaproteobacteria bacterium]